MLLPQQCLRHLRATSLVELDLLVELDEMGHLPDVLVERLGATHVLVHLIVDLKPL